MEPLRLESDQVTAYVDLPTKTAFIIYKGKLDAAVTQKVYAWINGMIAMYQEHAPAIQVIFDFRAVTEFDMTNLAKARTESQNISRSYDLSWMPAALLVANDHQKHMVGLSLKVSGQEARSRVVENEDEARAFFGEWWKNHSAPVQVEESSQESAGNA